MTTFIFKVSNYSYTKNYKSYNAMRKGVKTFALRNGYNHMDFIVFEGNKAKGKMWNNTKSLFFTVIESKI